MKLTYAPASAEHIPVIFDEAKKLIDAYEDTQAIDYEKVLAWVKKKITAQIASYTCVMLDGTVCAFYRLCEDGELDDLYVLPGFRSRGIGTAIIQKCTDEVRAPLWLYVFSSNSRAISFYRRNGFSVRQEVGKTRLILHRKG